MLSILLMTCMLFDMLPAAALAVNPNDSITREQLVTILWRYAGSPAAADSKGFAAFKDAGEISAYAENALAWANLAGIINGKGGSLLDPRSKATRAEAAQMMQNYMQKSG